MAGSCCFAAKTVRTDGGFWTQRILATGSDTVWATSLFDPWPEPVAKASAALRNLEEECGRLQVASTFCAR